LVKSKGRLYIPTDTMFCQLTIKATGAVRAASSRAQAGTWSRERLDRRLAARVRAGDDAKILTPRMRKRKKTDPDGSDWAPVRWWGRECGSCTLGGVTDGASF